MLPLALNSTFFSCNPRNFLLVYVNDSNQAMTLTKNSSYFFFRVFQWKPSLNSLTTHLYGSTFSMFLRILETPPRSYFIQSFSRIVHHTLEKSTNKRQMHSRPKPCRSQFTKKGFSLHSFFWNLSASAFFLFSVFIDLFYKTLMHTSP